MSNAVSSSTAVSVPDGYMAGVTVAVLRDALDLMKTQGEAVITMINSTPGAGSLVAEALDASSDPLLGQQVDMFI